MSLENALITQMTQKVRDGQTDPQTKRITSVAQLRRSGQVSLELSPQGKGQVLSLTALIIYLFRTTATHTR